MNPVRSWLERYQQAVAVALLLTTVALLYGHTLQVPYYLDDQFGLVDNYLLRDLPATLARVFSPRGLTNLTFALNYRLAGGWSLPALHLVNIGLHAVCGLLVWRILLRLVPTGRWLALCGALLFIAHPLQTQAVTYLVQRATVLAAVFFLAAFLLFLRARQSLAEGGSRLSPGYLLPYAGAVLLTVCAVYSKENTVTLPLVLLAWARLFPIPRDRGWRQDLADVLPFAVVPIFLAANFLVATVSADLNQVFHYSLASLRDNSPLNYLTTQFTVLWVYLRLLLVPFGQALEHNYPIITEFLQLSVLAGLGGLLLFAWLAWRWRRRWPLPGFGVAWFFLALAVESSFIPLDPLFEHRLYLPMFAVALLATTIVSSLRRQLLGYAVFALIIAGCGVLTWQRNALWQNPVAFYQQNLEVAPDSERALKALAALYEEDGRLLDSYRLLARAVEKHPDSYLLYGKLATHHAAFGDPQKAVNLLERGIRGCPECEWLYGAAADLYSEYGNNPEKSIESLQRGLSAAGIDKGKLYNTLGLYYAKAGLSGEAEQAFLSSLDYPAREIDLANVYFNLANEYNYQGRSQEAFSSMQMVLKFSPGDPEALERLGELSLRLRDRATALWAAERLKYANPQGERRLRAALDAAGM